MKRRETKKQLANRIFLNQDQSLLEMLTGLLTILASSWALWHDTYINQLWFYVCIVISVVQMLATFPLHNLKLRHYSNYLMTAISLMVVISIYSEHPQNEGVGGYSGAALQSFCAAFVTRLAMIKVYGNDTG